MKNAHKGQLPVWNPCEHEWELEHGVLKPVWYTGNRVPDNKAIEGHDNEEDNDEVESEDSSYDGDSAKD